MSLPSLQASNGSSSMAFRIMAFNTPLLRATGFHGTTARVPLVTNRAQALQPTRFVVTAAAPRMPAIMRPMVPSPALLDFVPDAVHPRSNVLKVLNAYVREHNLQDPKDRRVVLCDEKLKNLFGVDKCTILAMSKHITPHLRKPEDVGGKYIAEAKVFEEEYIRTKEQEGPAPKRTRTRKRTPKVAAELEEDLKAGRKLFKPVALSDDLSAICRQRKEMLRHEIVKSVWEYIRLNNLQSKSGEPIRCDFLLRKVFDAEEIDVRTIMKGIGAHVTKIE